MVHWAGLLYTSLLSFPMFVHGNWSVWFMGQVCYVLRYCLFLYLYMVTGLYGSWCRFAIYYATVFSYIFTVNWSVWFMGQVCYILRYCLFLCLYMVTGLYGSWGRFAMYYATVFSYIFS